MQQNSKCRLCGVRDETINRISECSKLAQTVHKTRHAWEGKVIHLEWCKKFKFDHTNKWYMNKPTSDPENDNRKLLETKLHSRNRIKGICNEKSLESQKQTTKIHSQYMGMENDIEKCAMLKMRSGKRQIIEETELPNQERTRTFGERDY